MEEKSCVRVRQFNVRGNIATVSVGATIRSAASPAFSTGLQSMFDFDRPADYVRVEGVSHGIFLYTLVNVVKQGKQHRLAGDKTKTSGRRLITVAVRRACCISDCWFIFCSATLLMTRVLPAICSLMFSGSSTFWMMTAVISTPFSRSISVQEFRRAREGSNQNKDGGSACRMEGEGGLQEITIVNIP